MMQNDFIAASANIETLDPGAEGMPIALQRIDQPINTILSNSFGFGGTNACMTFQKLS
jgi:3-oxoacyl-[acyl-carrier-protein] synthase-1